MAKEDKKSLKTLDGILKVTQEQGSTLKGIEALLGGASAEEAKEAKKAAKDAAAAEKKGIMQHTTLLEGIVSGLKDLKDSGNSGLLGLGKTFMKWAAGGLGILVAGISAPIVAIVSFFKQLSAEIKFLKNLTSGGINKIFAPIKNLFMGEGRIAKAIASIGKSINPKNWGWIKTIGLNLGKSKSVQGISKMFKGAGTLITKSLSFLGKIFKPIIGFFKAIFGLGRSAISMSRTAVKIMQFAKSFGQTLGKLMLPITILMGAFDFIKGFMKGYKEEGILGGLEGGISGVFKGIIGMPLDMLKNVASWILEKFGFGEMSKSLDSFSFSDLIDDMIGGIFDGLKKVIEWVKKLWSDPIGILTRLWDDMLEGATSIGKWIGDKVLKPITVFFVDLFTWSSDQLGEFDLMGKASIMWEEVKAWFNSLFDFSSMQKSLESLINIVYIIPNTIKEFLIDPAVDWLGKKFGFDTSGFTEFSIGELVMKGVNTAIEWLEGLFDFEIPTFEMPKMPSPKDLMKSMVPDKDSMFWKVPGTGSLYDMAYGKKSGPPKEATDWNKVKEDTKDTEAVSTKTFSSWYGSKEGKAALTKEFGTAMVKPKLAKEFFKSGAGAKTPTVTPSVPTGMVDSGKTQVSVPGAIDWSFISKKEGGSKLKGYVPDPKKSKSGVTIATGFDLGARGPQDIEGLSPELQAKLTPYLGLKKESALAAIQAKPLKITAAEAKEIDEMSHKGALSKLKSEWNKNAKKTGGARFEDLSSAQKTVAASVSFQYGSLSKTPKFRDMMQSGNWSGATAELQNFGDAYSTRRNDEARLLMASADPNQMIGGMNSMVASNQMGGQGAGGVTVINANDNSQSSPSSTTLATNPVGSIKNQKTISVGV